jgi:hypothetical protein
MSARPSFGGSWSLLPYISVILTSFQSFFTFAPHNLNIPVSKIGANERFDHFARYLPRWNDATHRAPTLP